MPPVEITFHTGKTLEIPAEFVTVELYQIFEREKIRLGTLQPFHVSWKLTRSDTVVIVDIDGSVDKFALRKGENLFLPNGFDRVEQFALKIGD